VSQSESFGAEIVYYFFNKLFRFLFKLMILNVVQVDHEFLLIHREFHNLI